MFTGLVEETGRVVRIEHESDLTRLTIDAHLILNGLQVGDSVANNGCCLTVIEMDGHRVTFDLLRETCQRTNLKDLAIGSLVNLERPLAANGRFGGHFVSGHIDCTGKITRWEKIDSDWADHVLEIEIPKNFEKYLVPKGSICIDGISLTVGEVKKNCFNAWIIPHTYQVTNLRQRQISDKVNLEFDLLAKYVEKMLASRPL